jgi:hypothetical protein
MKVCLVSFIAPYTIPYINIYIKKIKELQLDCDIIFWDRDGSCKDEVKDRIHYIPFVSKAPTNLSKIKRYLQYIPATIFIRKKLKKGNYNKVIFLQTHAAIACKSIILKQYSNKYIIDIRDFTLENFSLFRKVEKKVIEKSFCTVISSRGYKKFLPSFEYILAHNYTKIEQKILETVYNNCKKEKINIAFIGYIRFYDIAKKILILFANDSRFHISYIGTGANILKEFCDKYNIKNITLHDKFKPEETINFYKECDLINNLYGNHNNYLDFALSNKLYYAAQLHIPILVSEDTYSSSIVEKYHLGISWNPDEENSVDKLYKKYCEFDRKKMKQMSEKFLDEVIKDNKKFENKILEFLKD